MKFFGFIGILLTVCGVALGVGYTQFPEVKTWVQEDVLKIEQKVTDTTEKDNQIEELTTELEFALSEKETLESEVSTLQSEVSTLEAQLETATTDKASIQAELDSARTNLANKESVLELLELQILELHQKIEELEFCIEEADVCLQLSKTDSDLNVDSDGTGTSTYSLNMDLGTKLYKKYSALTSKEKSLIPSFDENESYITTLENVVYKFDYKGAYFVDGDNFKIAIIRLKADFTGVEVDSSVNNDNYYYLINFAFNDLYVKKIDIKTMKKGSTEYDVLKYYTDSIHQTQFGDGVSTCFSGKDLTGNFLTYFDEDVNDERTIDYSFAGYDGGIVFSSDYARELKIDFIISNVYQINLKTTEPINLLNNLGKTFDYGSFVIEISYTGTIYVKSKAGYSLSGFLMCVSKKDGSIDKTTVMGTYLKYQMDGTGDMVDLWCENIVINEYFCTLNIKDYNSVLIETRKIYYGYNDGLNCSYYGFSDFDRNTNLSIPTRDGYKFLGYSLNGEIVFDCNGLFIGEKSILFDLEKNNVRHNLIAEYEEII